MRPIIGITCITTDLAIGIGTSYINAIEHAGGTPVLLPLVRDNNCIEDFISLIDGLLLSGGVDVDPLFYGEEPVPAMGKIDVDKDYVEMALISTALKLDLPILGICRGIQVLNVAAGGTLYQDIYANPGKILKHRQDAPGSYATHTLDVYESSKLMTIIKQTKIRTNSFHHQAVKEVAPGFITSAIARDNIIEGIESTSHRFVIGVQFHPELMWQNTPPVANLFSAFINATKAYHNANNQR